MKNERIWLSPPHMGGAELEQIKKVFDSNWIAPVGPQLKEFEEALMAYTGSANCVVVSSGTAAIQLALIGLGVKPGDEVVCSTFTFAGSCNPIVYLGARPVFVDSDRSTWNMDPDLLEEGIRDSRERTGKNPACILLVQLYGMPARMDEILGIAGRYGIPVLEDAAEALGSSFKGQKLGTLTNVGVYSFNGNKIITTSGGGALVSNDLEMVEKARFLATQARDPAPHYQHSQIGYNFRLSNVSAAIGSGQMKVLDERVKRRREVFQGYRRSLEGFKGITFLNEPDGYFSNRWLTTITFERPDGQAIREALRLSLESENIESRPLWKPMHLQPVFANYPAFGNGVSEDLFNKGLCLPSGSSLTEDQQSRIIDAVKGFLVTYAGRP